MIQIGINIAVKGAEVLSIPPIAVPALVTPPFLSGLPILGQVLSCTSGVWTNNPTSYSYQWYRDPFPGGNQQVILGAVNSTYTVTPSDLNCFIICEVGATNIIGTNYAYSNQIFVI